MLNMQNVESSTIAKIGHDPLHKELHVDFKSGGSYVYHDVPASEYHALISAPSIGRHFAANVKNNYRFNRKG